MICVGIIGGAGYTAGELIRLLLHHPQATIAFVHSSSNAGNALTDVHAGLYGETDLLFTDQMPFDTFKIIKYINQGKLAGGEIFDYILNLFEDGAGAGDDVELREGSGTSHGI